MNENDMSQQERDAAEVERMRIGLSTFGAFAPEYYRAAINTIDALTADRERLKAKESALRDELARAYRDLADMHEGEGYHNDAKRYRARAEAMEAPPRNESDGAK